MALPRPLYALAAAAALAGCGEEGVDESRFDLRTPPPYVGAKPLPGHEPSPMPGVLGASAPTPRPLRGDFRPTQRDAERLRSVLAAWADALRRSDAEAAASYFLLPAVVAQPTAQPRELRTAGELRAFNASLPCGARLLEVQHDGRYVVGTFRLTQRPGSRCGDTGALVRVAFVFRGRRFTEWWQVPDGRGAAPGPETRPEFDASGRFAG